MMLKVIMLTNNDNYYKDDDDNGDWTEIMIMIISMMVAMMLIMFMIVMMVIFRGRWHGEVMVHKITKLKREDFLREVLHSGLDHTILPSWLMQSTLLSNSFI